MKKSLFIIFSIAVLALMLFGADFCLALNEPENLETSFIGEGSAILRWEWPPKTKDDEQEEDPGEGILKQFKLLYKDTESAVWTPEYPIADSGTIIYSLTGLEEDTPYQWRVKAEAQNPVNDSSFTADVEFTTTLEDTPPPDENGSHDMIPIKLKNPLNQDTLWGAINALIDFFIVLAFAIVPILIIYSAFLMLFAGGDAVKINKGKSIILWALIALAVILFAKGLPSVIKGAFGG